MQDFLSSLQYLGSGAQLRRIYDKLQIAGDKAYREAGIDFKSSWFPVYVVLAKATTPLSINQITEQIAYSHITVKNITRELAKKQYVIISPNPSDKRSKLVWLSKRGKSLVNQIKPLWQDFSIALKDIFEDGHPEIIAILNRINKTLDYKSLNERIQLISAEDFEVRQAVPSEYERIGRLMVDVYSKLDGFPSESEQPGYYTLLTNVGKLTQFPKTEILVSASPGGQIGGAVVYFGDMQFYGSGGIAPNEPNAGGFRLLAVDPLARGKGLGKKLTKACIDKGREDKLHTLIIHTTKAMETAWKMYIKFGFKRSKKFDFKQGDLQVLGFQLKLN